MKTVGTCEACGAIVRLQDMGRVPLAISPDDPYPRYIHACADCIAIYGDGPYEPLAQPDNVATLPSVDTRRQLARLPHR